MSRFVWLDYPVAHPGKCAGCGCNTRHDGRRYADMGIQVIRYGRIYMCSICFMEVAQGVELIDKEIFDKALSALGHARLERDELRARNERLVGTIRELELSRSDDTQPIPDEEFLPDSPREDTPQSEPDVNSDLGAESGSDESDDVEGSASVRDDDIRAILTERHPAGF